MIDFFTSTWGIFLILHVAGFIYFQPYLVRNTARGTQQVCANGNTDKVCRELHPDTCRFLHGIQIQPESGDIALGTLMALFWEITAGVYFLIRRANKPDKIQRQYQENRDEVLIATLEKARDNLVEIQRANKMKELVAARAEGLENGEEVEDLESIENVEVEAPTLREVYGAIENELERAESYKNSWGTYETPEWIPRGQYKSV